MNDKQKVWVVYEGGYDNYSVTFIGAYTDEETAERVSNKSCRYNIEVVEVDVE